MDQPTAEQPISSKLQDKLDYCQQCHLHKDECKCEETFQVSIAAENTAPKETRDIMLSTWTISIKGVQKTVEGVVIVDKGKEKVMRDDTFRRRVKRELKLNNEDFEVLDLVYTKKLGETYVF
jgi:hypothetical protein